MSSSNNPDSKKSLVFDYEKQDQAGISDVKYHNIIITLSAVSIIPLYLYGVRVLLLIAFSLLGAIIADIVCIKIFYKRDFVRQDCSSFVTAFICALLLPATAPVWLPMVSTMIGLVVAKYPFGGTGKNIFNPAAVGTAFCALCWPELALKYPVPFTTYSLNDELIQYAISPASRLQMGGEPPVDYFDVLLGNFPGPMGATCMIVIFSCMLYLMFRKMISKSVVISSVLVVIIFALLFPRVLTSRFSSVVYELSCEAYMFGVVFMASDPTTLPKTKGGRVLFGIVLSTVLMLMRYFGKIELHFVYALLIANVFGDACDRYILKISEFIKKSRQKPKNKANDIGVDKAGESHA